MLQILSERYNISINEILSGEMLDKNNYKESAEKNIKYILDKSIFSRKDNIEFFKRKWRKDHLLELMLEIIILIIAMILGFIFNNGLKFIAVIGILVWIIVQQNRMMAYVEKKVYYL